MEYAFRLLALNGLPVFGCVVCDVHPWGLVLYCCCFCGFDEMYPRNPCVVLLYSLLGVTGGLCVHSCRNSGAQASLRAHGPGNMFFTQQGRCGSFFTKPETVVLLVSWVSRKTDWFESSIPYKGHFVVEFLVLVSEGTGEYDRAYFTLVRRSPASIDFQSHHKMQYIYSASLVFRRSIAKTREEVSVSFWPFILALRFALAEGLTDLAHLNCDTLCR